VSPDSTMWALAAQRMEWPRPWSPGYFVALIGKSWFVTELRLAPVTSMCRPGAAPGLWLMLDQGSSDG
jgi:hypothetical protein